MSRNVRNLFSGQSGTGPNGSQHAHSTDLSMSIALAYAAKVYWMVHYCCMCCCTVPLPWPACFLQSSFATKSQCTSAQGPPSHTENPCSAETPPSCK